MESFAVIGERLREERKRLALSQEELAHVADLVGATGATRQSQALYEKGERYPDATYLSAVFGAGVDVRYVLTGLRDGQLPLDVDENALVLLYRAAPPTLRQAAKRVLSGQDAAAKRAAAVTVNVKGDVGQQFAGGINAPQTFVMNAPAPPAYKRVAKKKV